MSVVPPEPRRIGPVTLTDFVRYQGASGDLNPLHHDAEAARALGYAGPFAPGMWAAGLLAGFATDWLGPANLRRYAVRFAEQIWPGDVLTCAARVSREYVENGVALVDVALTCRRERGGDAVTAAATFAVPAAERSADQPSEPQPERPSEPRTEPQPEKEQSDAR